VNWKKSSVWKRQAEKKDRYPCGNDGFYNAPNWLSPIRSTRKDNQTCTDTYDDLARVSGNNCGSTWAQTFSFDAFGNVSKSGSISWQPTYNSPANNNPYLTGWNGASYDADGSLLNDTFNTYTWDAYGNLASANAATITYDALFSGPT
jgi:hypothetical protein